MDMDMLVKLSKEQLEQVKAAMEARIKKEENPTNYGKGTSLRISDDKMEAWLYLAPPAHTETYEREEVAAYIKENGVTYGYIESNISAMVKKKVYGREIRVAKGKNVKDGMDGYYEYFFDPNDFKKSPLIKEDGTVDYASMSMLQNVAKGEKLAEYHPAIEGEDGYDVTGKLTPAKKTRQLIPLRGRGFSVENNVYYAQEDGKVQLRDGRLDIQNVHEIRTDVDLIIGRVEFFGDIVIDGNVENGVLIRAGRNLVINGTVAAASLYAGGDIILKRGIQGNYKAKAEAKGNIYADFIEYATVKAVGNIQANYILNSQVSSEQKVILTGKLGSIIGGYTQGMQGIEAQETGNDTAEIKTIIHSGYEATDYARYLQCGKEEAELQQALSIMVDQLKGLLKQKVVNGVIPGVNLDEMMQDVTKQKDEVFRKLDAIRIEEERLAKLIDAARDSYIKIEKAVNRGTVIGMEATELWIMEPMHHMLFKINGGKILQKRIER